MQTAHAAYYEFTPLCISSHT